MTHEPPKNSEAASDERYWYLREMQALLQVPINPASREERKKRGVQRSKYTKRNVLDVTTGDPVRVGKIAKIVDSEALLILAHGGRALHLVEGTTLMQSLLITLPDGGASNICADEEYVFILFERDVVARVPVLALLQKPAQDSLSKQAPLASFPVQYSKIPEHLAGRSMVAISASNGRSRLLFYGRTLAELSTLVWSVQKSQAQQLVPDRSSHLESVRISSAAFSSSTNMVYFTDEHGGRVLKWDLEAPGNGKITVHAGDGVRNDGPQPRFGNSPRIRLGEVIGICEFALPREIAADLSEVVMPVNGPEWWRRGFVKRPAGFKEKFTFIQQAATTKFDVSHKRIAEAIESDTSFLVVIDRSHQAAFTLSLSKPSANGKPADHQLIWPLLPPRESVPDPVMTTPVKVDFENVCTGPGASLIFWTGGETQIAHYVPHLGTLKAWKKSTSNALTNVKWTGS